MTVLKILYDWYNLHVVFVAAKMGFHPKLENKKRFKNMRATFKAFRWLRMMRALFGVMRAF